MKTKSEKKMQRYLGMFPRILGFKLDEEIIMNIIETRPTGLFSF